MPTNLEYLTTADSHLTWAKAFGGSGASQTNLQYARAFCDHTKTAIDAADAQTAAGPADAEFTSCRTNIAYAKACWAVGQPTVVQNYGVTFASNAQKDIADLRVLLTPPAGDDMRCVMWTNMDSVLAMSPETIAQMKAYGVDGYILQAQYMPDLGTNLTIFNSKLASIKAFADANPTLDCYVGFRLAHWASSGGGAPPQWFDDAKWAKVNSAVALAAQACEDSELMGISFDGEGFPPNTPDRRDSPVAGQTDGATRTKAENRGESVAATIEAIDDSIEVLQYHIFIPGSWREIVQHVVNDDPDAYANHTAQDWIRGITSSGLTFRHCDAVFYKSPHISNEVDTDDLDTPGDPLTEAEKWAQAFTINNANWETYDFGALSTVFQTPMIWITNGPKARAQIAAGQPVTAFDAARSPEQVATQLAAARTGTQGKTMILYHQGAILPHEWAPYASSIQTASA